ncbi:hypothetical protein BASA81_007504 [Batrachochytrium salamandrivorans]|nr:hypothetical protein BASA81_007504 [Batrachochytrium salamandrivorans]
MSKVSIITADGKSAIIVNQDGKVASTRSAAWKTIDELRGKIKSNKELNKEETNLVEYLNNLGIKDLVLDDKYLLPSAVRELFKTAQLVEFNTLLSAGAKERRSVITAYEKEYFDKFRKQNTNYTLRSLEEDDDNGNNNEEEEELPVPKPLTIAKEGEPEIQPDSDPKSQAEEDREEYVEGELEKAKEGMSDLMKAARELQAAREQEKLDKMRSETSSGVFRTQPVVVLPMVPLNVDPELIRELGAYNDDIITTLRETAYFKPEYLQEVYEDLAAGKYTAGDFITAKFEKLKNCLAKVVQH